MTDESRKHAGALSLGIDPATITEVREALGPFVVTPFGYSVKARWSDVNLVSGERYGYSEKAPGVLWWRRKAAR